MSAFTITVDNYAVRERFFAMESQLRQLPFAISETFIDWQSEDLNRRKPFLVGKNRRRQYTKLYPFGYKKKVRVKLAPGEKRKRKKRTRKKDRRKRVARLRPELLAEFQQDMREMMQRELRWD